MALSIPGRTRNQTATTSTTAPPVTPGQGSTTGTTLPPATAPGAGFVVPDSAALDAEALALAAEELRIAIATGEDVSLAKFGDLNVRWRGTREDRYGARTTTGTRSISSVLTDIGRWSDEELTLLQNQLYSAGYYAKPFYEDPTGNRIAWGWMDAATRRAVGMLLADGVQFSSQSLQDIIGRRRSDYAESGLLANGVRVRRPAVTGGGNLYTTEVSSEAGIGELADQVAQSVLGRDVSDADKAKYVHLIQGRQRASQGKVHSAQEANARRNFDADTAMADANLAGSEGGGGLLNPVPGGTFVDTMGAPRDGGSRDHRGTDIFAPKGTPVLAPVSGEIVQAGSSGRGGNRVWIKGDDGRFHYLAHLDSITIDTGRVTAGQPVGTVGTTGNASGGAAHLHYSINSGVGDEDAIGNPALEIGAQSAAGGTTYAQGDQYLDPAFVETTSVDAAAELTTQIEADQPAEAGAKRISDQYQQFRSVIGAQRGVQ